MQRSLEDFRKSGGQLIAIAPLIMKNAAALKEKLHLTFPIITYTGNIYCRHRRRGETRPCQCRLYQETRSERDHSSA